ncbi:MAG: hypothetical protein ACRD1X_04055 [Vicinamibacteria bacterium]
MATEPTSPRVRRARASVLVLLLLGLPVLAPTRASGDDKSDPMIIAMRPGDTQLTDAPSLPMKGTGGWLELGRVATSGRYRLIDGGSSQRESVLQYQFSMKTRLKLDTQGKLGLSAGVFTGDGFGGGWNRFTRSGSGEEPDLFLKQLHLSAQPVAGLEIQYGGLEIAHGESTEVTGYDFDGYLMGQRGRLESFGPLDEVSITYAYLGDLDNPSVFDRFRRLGSPNYWQLLGRKELASGGGVSADYTNVSGEETLRQAVRLPLPDRSQLDTVQLEVYERLPPEAGFGFGLYSQKKLHPAITLGGGYARIDRNGLNSDRFPRGNRIYGTLLVAVHRAFGLSVFLSRRIGAVETSENRTRLDVALSYDLLAATK